MSKIKPTDKKLLEVTKWFSEWAIAFNRGKSFLDFQNDVQLNLASTMAITQIAENSKSVSEDVKERHPSFPWRKIVGLRNIISHNYDGISMDIICGAINEHLPELIKGIDYILENDSELLKIDAKTVERYTFNNIPFATSREADSGNLEAEKKLSLKQFMMIKMRGQRPCTKF